MHRGDRRLLHGDVRYDGGADEGRLQLHGPMPHRHTHLQAEHVHAVRLLHLCALTRVGPGLLLLGAAACGGADGSPLLEGDDSGLDVFAPDVASQDVAASDGGTSDAGMPKLDASNDASPKEAGYVDPGIACGKTDCDAGAELCCATITSYYPTYTYAFACEPTTDLVQCAAGIGVYCDDDHDCPPSAQLCCGDLGYQRFNKVSCKPTCTGVVYGVPQIHFCNPNAPDCEMAQTCTASMVMPGYYVCQ